MARTVPARQNNCEHFPGISPYLRKLCTGDYAHVLAAPNVGKGRPRPPALLEADGAVHTSGVPVLTITVTLH